MKEQKTKYFSMNNTRFELLNQKSGLNTYLIKSFLLIQQINKDAKSEFHLDALNIRGVKVKSGIRQLRSNVFYGDILYLNVKSLIILHKIEPCIFEMYFFYGFYPEEQDKRSSFFTSFFTKTGIANTNISNKNAFEYRNYCKRLKTKGRCNHD